MTRSSYEREPPIKAPQPGLEKRARGPVGERLVSPEQLPRLQIVGEHLALRSALEDSSISDERIANQPIPGREIDRPGEPQVRHRLGVDLAQAGVVLHVGRIAEQRPSPWTPRRSPSARALVCSIDAAGHRIPACADIATKLQTKEYAQSRATRSHWQMHCSCLIIRIKGIAQ